MNRTRTVKPIDPPMRAQVRLNGKVVPVQVVSSIRDSGGSFNEVILPDGSKKRVPNDSLIFRDA